MWASEHIPELEAIGSLSAITFVVCRRLAAIEAARPARIAALPRVQHRRGGVPVPSLDDVLELSSGVWARATQGWVHNLVHAVPSQEVQRYPVPGVGAVDVPSA